MLSFFLFSLFCRHIVSAKTMTTTRRRAAAASRRQPQRGQWQEEVMAASSWSATSTLDPDCIAASKYQWNFGYFQAASDHRHLRQFVDRSRPAAHRQLPEPRDRKSDPPECHCDEQLMRRSCSWCRTCFGRALKSCDDDADADAAAQRVCSSTKAPTFCSR